MRPQSTVRVLAIAIGGLSAGAALAAPDPSGSIITGPGLDQGAQPFGGVDEVTFPIFGDDDVSMGLVAYDDSGGFLGNYASPANVAQGENFSLGTTPGGTEVLGTWGTQTIDETTSQLFVRYYTADQSPLVPNGTQLDSEAVGWLGWGFGVDNPLEFADTVTETNLNSATVRALDANRQGPSQSFTSLFDDNRSLWSVGSGVQDGGDESIDLIQPGQGYVEVELSYQFSVVPAPGTLALLALGGLPALRRRR